MTAPVAANGCQKRTTQVLEDWRPRLGERFLPDAPDDEEQMAASPNRTGSSGAERVFAMPELTIRRTSPVTRSPRVQQLEGWFDLPPTEIVVHDWTFRLPWETQPWQLGAIVGPSGCGKSTLARELFGSAVVSTFPWSESRALLDDFPESLSIQEVVGLLSSVGFSSPPSWRKPFSVLSQGEQFRVTLARALAVSSGLVVMDEFTSVVDRVVARCGCAAIARWLRRRPQQQFVAVSCHTDIVEWLCPDWVYEPQSDTFHWRSERRRPDVVIDITRTEANSWRLFREHHYLNHDLGRGTICFLATIEQQIAGFSAVISSPHPRRPGWREHRTVVLPDYQGLGLGSALAEFVASLFAATGKPFRSVTSHPAVIAHRRRSPLWRVTRTPRTVVTHGSMDSLWRAASLTRATWSFEYIGPVRAAAAQQFGLRVSPRWQSAP